MTTPDTADALVRAVQAGLRPVVQRLVKRGVPFGRVAMQLRELYVEVAEAALRERHTVTDSGVASLTGLSRREVHRIRGARRDDGRPQTFERNAVTHLVGAWLRDRRSTDAAGKPVPLPYRGRLGLSFVRLAQQATRDVRPQALLETMVTTGVAEVLPDQRIALTTVAYVPRRGRAPRLHLLAEDPAELLETMLHNVLDEGSEPWLQQKAIYDRLGADGMARLRAELRREGERFIQRMSRRLARHDRDVNPAAAGGDDTVAGIGIYYFERPAAVPRVPSAKARKKK